MSLKKTYHTIVIGAGHSGIEAACASARIGAKTLLLTMNIENLGELSCNPAIGGIGKGTVVREIDALDGIMGKACDMASINRRILNRSKGPAVWGLRHQIDRELYKKAIKELLNGYENLDVQFGIAEEIVVEDGFSSSSECEMVVVGGSNKIIKGINVNGALILCKSLVVTTGTFLNGKIIIGEERYSAGRINEKPSIKLGESLKNLGLEISRLKTGTPCRLNFNTIDFTGLEEQQTETENTPPMSYMNCYSNKIINIPQMSCFMTYTNEKSHKIIKQNQHRIPTLNGDIKFRGPRYCPSIEDKINRFTDKDRHQIFLEPEGLNSNLIYPNGISTSMPKDMQTEFIHSIKGLENAEIIRFGYAIEYDFVNPLEVKHTLETKKIAGLFLAGQILGTTGYEEAAGQGIIAGINAGLYSNYNHNTSKEFEKSFILDRTSSYIGVMIDDLVTNGVGGEPYRLFTSRSEYRISCRADNADMRLTNLGININVVKNERKILFKEKEEQYFEKLTILKNVSITPFELKQLNFDINQDGIRRNAFELLQNQNFLFDNLLQIAKSFPQWNNFYNDIINTRNDIKELINTEAKYFFYLIRQQNDINEFKKNENIKIPENLNFKLIGSLSNEVVEKLNKVKPATIGQASRIPGITPAAVLAIMINIKKNNVL